MNTRTALILTLMLAPMAPAVSQPVLRDRGTRPIQRYNEDDPYGYDRAPVYREYRPENRRYARGTRDVAGVITSSTGAFDRNLRVLLDNGEERTIQTPKNAVVRRNGRPVSVHELRSGESVRIRLDRYEVRGTLYALRIDATETYRQERRGRYVPDAEVREMTLRGSVRGIDSKRKVLRLEVDMRRVTVLADRASIRDERGALEFRNLETGDCVIVEGRKDGGEWRATRVTVEKNR